MIKSRTSALVCLILCSFTNFAYSFTASISSRSTSCSPTYSSFVSKRRGTGCSRQLVDDRFSPKTVVRSRRQVLRATIPTIRHDATDYPLKGKRITVETGAIPRGRLACRLLQDLKGKERLEKFLADCVLMGPVRFVCMTDAAVLEAVGSFDNLRYNDVPKGRYATVSEGRSFECHLNMDRIKAINMVTKRSKDNDFDLYITRFLDEKGDTLLSAMLHSTDGVYEPGATDYWQKLRKSFGAEQTIE